MADTHTLSLHVCIAQALKYFTDAEETTPGFFSVNWLFLAKCHYQLSHKAEARQWLTKLLEHPVQNAEEREVCGRECRVGSVGTLLCVCVCVCRAMRKDSS